MNAAPHAIPAGPTHASRAWLQIVDDAVVGFVLSFACILAPLLATLDGKLRPRRTARFRAQIARLRHGNGDGSAELIAIWFARAAREGLRLLLIMGFADAVLRRVHLTANGGAHERSCVYAIYHTPWGRVLALWLTRQPEAVVYSARRWVERAGAAHVPCTWQGLRGLVARLKNGSSAVVTADHFARSDARSARGSLLGREVRVSTGAARIAAAAGVPIVPVTTRYQKGRLEIAIGPAIRVDAVGVADATQRITAAFDVELRRDPSAWETAHRFLSVASVPG